MLIPSVVRYVAQSLTLQCASRISLMRRGTAGLAGLAKIGYSQPNNFIRHKSAAAAVTFTLTRSKSNSREDTIDSNASMKNAIQNQEQSQNVAKRIKLKFNWKNSLVTADAINLLENLYKTYPQLVEFDETELLNYLERISGFLIDVERATEMLLIYPRVMAIPNEKISACVSALRSIGLSENQRKSVLRRAPQLLDIPSSRLTKHFTFLKTYLTSSETIDVITKSVEVFLEAESSLKKKLDFLIKNMSHETKNIVSCKALSYSLKHLKTRHEFLIRAGFFKPIPYNKLIKVLEKDYKDKNKQRDKYFKPIEIVCYKDEDYLKSCTSNLLTLNELAAFEELFQAELRAADDLECENDDVDDIDEEENEEKDAISLIKVTNSGGFFNDVEAKSCYF